MIAALAFFHRVRRSLSPTGWLIVGVLLAFLVVGAWCSHRGAQGEKDRQAGAAAVAERKAATGREKAAVERSDDAASSQARLDQRNDDAEALPDALPDTRERSRRCRQLRDAGINVPECA